MPKLPLIIAAILVALLAGGAVFYTWTVARSVTELKAEVQESGSAEPTQALKAIQTARATSLEAIDKSSKATLKKISDLSKASAASGKSLSVKDGKLMIGGKCFKPVKLARCWSTPRNDHMTWLGNADECRKAKYTVEGEVEILAAC
ncbi:MAG: hypothetical protein ABJN40_05530 [Sneathiella sp.]